MNIIPDDDFNENGSRLKNFCRKTNFVFPPPTLTIQQRVDTLGIAAIK